MTTRIDITDHAVLRYAQRHARGTPHAQARADIERLASEATPLRERTLRGQQLWRIDKPPMILVVKPDAGRYVCVTVLPPAVADEAEDDSVEAEIVDAYARIRHLVERDGSTVEIKNTQENVAALCSKLRAQIDSFKTARDAVKTDLHKICADSPDNIAALTESEERHLIRNLRAQLAVTERKYAMKGEEKHTNEVLRAQLAAAERRYEKQVAHGKLMETERNQGRKLLAVAMRGLVRSDDPNARAIFHAIALAEPWTSHQSYWDREIDLTPRPADSNDAPITVHTCTVCFRHHVPEPCCQGCDCGVVESATPEDDLRASEQRTNALTWQERDPRRIR